MTIEPEQTGSRRTGEPFARKTRPLGTRPLLLLLWGAAAAVLLVDQLTKVWAVSALSDGHRVSIIGDWLTLYLIRNPGAAFSFATGQTWVFTLIAVVVAVVVVRVSHRLGSRAWAVTLGLVMGGAVGNLIDRLVRSPGILRGHVVDFISYGHLFIGNVADIAIVVAAFVIMALSLVGLGLDGARASGERRDGERAAVAVLGEDAVSTSRARRSAGAAIAASTPSEEPAPERPALDLVDDETEQAAPREDDAPAEDDEDEDDPRGVTLS